MPTFIEQIYAAASAEDGGVVRRGIGSMVAVGISPDDVIADAQKRGFTVVENGDQLVFFCNEFPMVLHTYKPVEIRV